ncbi:MAG: hypothetical protein HZB85_06180 [Deltaproteobacteria bacterium]|nr:hypothetical protein [Deltaproteobacteria bacterium]
MMKKPHSLWQTLERVPGLAAVEAEWMALLGPEYELAKNLLRPNGKYASSYPCPAGCGCAHKVITHSTDDIVAVCRCEPKRCDTVELKRTDIAVYELNWNALGTVVASVLQAFQEDVPVDGLPMTRRIGTYSPYAGFRFPVYLTIQLEPEEFQRVVESLVSREDRPFILIAPTHDLYRPECEKLLQRKNARFFPLVDLLVCKDDGLFPIDKTADIILADFRSVVLPSPEDAGSMVFFPTPPDATWGDVSIKFKDGHTVSIKAGNASGTYNYTQMGMADERNGNPTKQWKLLESFATAHGKFSWEHSDATRKNQKRREVLAENLHNFFRIEGDPFRWTKDGKAWEASFKISYVE